MGRIIFVMLFLVIGAVSPVLSQTDSSYTELDHVAGSLEERVAQLEKELVDMKTRMEEMDSVFSVKLVEGGAERFSNAWPP